MDCDNCKKKSVPEIVSRYFFEETVARMDIAHRRVWILCIVLAVMLVASWVGFFIYESQFETVPTSTMTQEVEQQADGDGNNNFVGGDNYGVPTESENDENNDEDPQTENGR